jgi:hypothetical protein
VDALVLERVVGRAEELLERFAVVERGIVLAGMKRTSLTLSPLAIVQKLRQPLAPLSGDRRSYESGPR